MIIATVTKKHNEYYSFECKGHAEYADAGEDIVCAAVSMLVINTINSIEKYCDIPFEASNKDYISWRFLESPDVRVNLLMDSMLLGLSTVRKKYGDNYLRLIIEEV